MLLVVSDTALAAEKLSLLGEAGYSVEIPIGDSEKAVLHKIADGVCTHNLYIVSVSNDEEIKKAVGLVRMLSNDADMALQYADVKKKLAEKYAEDESAYNDGKARWLDGEDPLADEACCEPEDAPVVVDADEKSDSAPADEKTEESAEVVAEEPSVPETHEEAADKCDGDDANAPEEIPEAEETPSEEAASEPTLVVNQIPAQQEVIPEPEKTENKKEKPKKEKREKIRFDDEDSDKKKSKEKKSKSDRKAAREKRRGRIASCACLAGTAGFLIGTFAFSNGILGLIIGLVAGYALGFGLSMIFEDD
jgi:F0F1-type ATP synthase assembly protein I